MLRLTVSLVSALVLWSGCAAGPFGSGARLGSGIELENFDTSVSPQEDFYRYVNGTWLQETEIPDDKSNYGSFDALFDESQKNLRAIIEEAAYKEGKVPGSDEQKVGDFYLGYMDTVRVEQQGLEPVREELARIAGISSREELLGQIAHLRKIGVQTPIGFYVSQDAKVSDQYISYINQSGLGLPDRDYYFKEDDKFKDIRKKYVAYIEQLLTLADQPDATTKAARIMEIETALAEHHWTRTENRDREKTYNKYDIAQLNELTHHFSWSIFIEAAGIPRVEQIVVRQPSYLTAFDQIFSDVSVDDWKAYFTWKILNSVAPLLGGVFVDANFEFYGRTLRGLEANLPRWKRAVNAIDGILGEVVGKVYVERHFKPADKARMEQLVQNVVDSFEDRLKNLEWMGPETKEEALVKLAKFNAKIGYPDVWKDYSELEITAGELVKNYARANQHEYKRMIGKLGRPIDRNEWFMTPQTVNAYYSSSMNEIVFPAAILQPPFFNMAADDAVNYGAIGAVIGHEITHGFDDQGRKSDGDGNLRTWWTDADEAEFKKRAQVVVEQYAGYVPIDTMHINGELTLGENIADLGGVTIAYYAYKKSLGGKKAPVIDGFTGDQRFFIGWTQIWQRLYRDEELRRRLLTDPHSPSGYRVNGVVSNMPEFYSAFDVKAGDAMYHPDELRVKIW